MPVAYLIGLELRERRAGIAAAALAAVNPMLLWYSQEARAYALFALLCAISTLYFVCALRRGGRSDLAGWGIASALALATHYFAIFPIAVEAIWLLRRRGRRATAGLAIVAVAGLALAPLVIHQASIGHAEWIADHALLHRLWETPATFFAGETGEIIARGDSPLPAVVPFVLACASLLLIWLRGAREERRAAAIPLVLVAAAVGLPVVIALVSPSKDYVLARNLIAALVPLLVAVAIGVTLPGARRIGIGIGAALVAYCFAFSVWVSVAPAWQRPNWDALATRLGEPTAPRAIVTWTLGQAPLRHYLADGSFQVFPEERCPGTSTRSTSSRPALCRRCRGRCSGPASARSATKRSVADSTCGATRCPARTWGGCGCAACGARSSASAATTVLIDGASPG